MQRCTMCRAHTLVMRKPLHTSSLADIVAAAPLALVGLEGAPPVAQVLRDEAAAVRQASLPDATPGLLLVGPEGGWSPTEIEFAGRMGCHVLSLGPFILRTETAALVAISQLQYHFSKPREFISCVS